MRRRAVSRLALLTFITQNLGLGGVPPAARAEPAAPVAVRPRTSTAAAVAIFSVTSAPASRSAIQPAAGSAGPGFQGYLPLGLDLGAAGGLSGSDRPPLAMPASLESRTRPRRRKMPARSFEMSRTVVIKGRVVGPSTVELEQPLPERTREVEVVARVADKTGGRLSDYLRSLPPGTRSKEDIDRQIREERDSWS